MSKNVQWDITPGDMFVELLHGYVELLVDGLVELAKASAPEIAADMKANAKWTDRTGHARQALDAQARRLPDGAEIEFGHGEAHGFWLEVAHAGVWGIVTPTLDKWGPVMAKRTKALVR